MDSECCSRTLQQGVCLSLEGHKLWIEGQLVVSYNTLLTTLPVLCVLKRQFILCFLLSAVLHIRLFFLSSSLLFWAELKDSRWTHFSPKGNFLSLYVESEKRTADLQWRIVYAAIATNTYRTHLDSRNRIGVWVFFTG